MHVQNICTGRPFHNWNLGNPLPQVDDLQDELSLAQRAKRSAEKVLVVIIVHTSGVGRFDIEDAHKLIYLTEDRLQNVESIEDQLTTGGCGSG